jgi:hypothetical protein
MQAIPCHHALIFEILYKQSQKKNSGHVRCVSFWKYYNLFWYCEWKKMKKKSLGVRKVSGYICVSDKAGAV